MAERESGDDRGRNSGRTGAGADDPTTHDAGDDRVTGTSGNDDPTTHNATDDRVTGTSGRDAVDRSGESVRGHLFEDSGTETVDRHGSRTTTYSGVEELRFLDGRVVLDDSDPAAQVVRLYRAALGRDADQGGLNAWISRLEGGGRLSDLAEAFLRSPEFQVRYGSLDDTAYVDRLYQNVLGRSGDAGGSAYWLGQLRGGASRQDVLAGFAESAENKAGTGGVIASGIWDRSETAQEVARLYDTVFGRLPDAAGLGYWRGRLDDGSARAEDVADAFTRSGEFAQRYGALSNRDFVAAVYGNTLHRAPDAGGLDYWTAQLDGGGSRAAIVVGFSESAEHVGLTAANILGSTPGGYGIALA